MHRYMLTVRRFNEKDVPAEAGAHRLLHGVHRTGGVPDRDVPSRSSRSTGYSPSYRDPGTCLVRGVPLKALFDQMMANADDENKGRQMGVHWGFRHVEDSVALEPRGAKLSHAVGIAYAAKYQGREGRRACVVRETAPRPRASSTRP